MTPQNEIKRQALTMQRIRDALARTSQACRLLWRAPCFAERDAIAHLVRTTEQAHNELRE